MSDTYGSSGGSVLRRAILFAAGGTVAAILVPRLIFEDGPVAPTPSPAATKPAPAPRAAASSAAPQVDSGAEQSYRASAGNQFFVKASVNGTQIPFMIDTGATLVSLRPEDAQRLGFSLSSLRWDVPTATANGQSFAAAVTLGDIRLGDVVKYNVPALVMQKSGGISLLGMSFLSRLKSWHIADGVLTIAD